MAELDILTQLTTLSPVIALLVAAIVYLVNRNNKLETEIKELNLFIRESEKRNIEILNKVTNTLDKILDDNTHMTSDIKGYIDVALLKNKSN